MPKKESGYTLIELIAVVALLAVVSAFFISRFSFSSEWAIRDSVSQFVNTLNFLKIDSKARQVKYLVEIDVNQNSYRVWQVLTPLTNTSQNVDLLSGFRTKEETQRRQEKAAREALANLSSNYDLDAQLDGLPLENQFFGIAYADTSAEGTRIPPLESPSLSETKYFSPEIKISDIELASNHLLDQFNTSNNVVNIPVYPGMSGANFSIVFDTNSNKIRVSSLPGFGGIKYETL